MGNGRPVFLAAAEGLNGLAQISTAEYRLLQPAARMVIKRVELGGILH